MLPQQPYEQGNSNQMPSMMPSYAYEQVPYYVQSNDTYYSVPNFSNQQLYIQPVNSTKGNFQGYPKQDQYQNTSYQYYNQGQIPISYINAYPTSQSSQQHLPPKLKASVKPYNQPLISVPTPQIQTQQSQLYLNQNQIIQPQNTASINIQPQFTQNSLQRSYDSQKVQSNDYSYQYNSQQQQSQQSKKQTALKYTDFLTDPNPPPAFDIIGHGDLPSVYFSFDH